MGFNFSIGVSGLKAAQIGMDVTSHNIANVNTPNFQRQVVELQDVYYNSGSPKLPSGSGVDISSIHNVTDPLLTRQYPTALSNSSEYDSLNGLTKPFDDLLNNPSLNLSTAMQNTFNAFQDVADNPTSISTRQNAIAQATSLVDKSQNLMGQLNELKNSLTGNYQGSAEQVNSIVNNIANINKQINYNGPNNSADLISQRDGLTYDLAKLTGINISDDKNTITTTSGKILLNGGVNPQLLNEKDIPQITGGSIGGTNKFVNTMLNPAISKLPEVINSVANEINQQATQGYDMNGNQGSSIFNIGTNGISIAINDPKTLGASTSQTGIGDGTNAQKMSDLKNKLYNGQTLQNQYTGLISNIDSRAKSYSDIGSSYNSVTTSLNNKIQSISGVNLDEEAVNMLKYQRMYEANAKVIQTQNEMFGTLINIKA